MRRAVVIGAGIGGLSTAVTLARAGLDVTVLEAHVYPGGSAGTFYHQGYRFDAGATLAGGFYQGGPMDLLAQVAGIQHWPAQPTNETMVVHLPDGTRVTRWADQRRWDEYQQAFGDDSLKFWRWQEDTADALWDLALRLPAWPPQSPSDLANLAGEGIGWLASAGLSRFSRLPRLSVDAFSTLGSHLQGLSEQMKLFIDAQLLISAQTTSLNANALYGASALDLPRRGVVHLEGGMGRIAHVLAQAVRDFQGRVLYRQKATRIRLEQNRPAAVETKRGESFDADIVVANLTPWNIANLFGKNAPSRLRRLPPDPPGNWGAFMLYLGVEGSVIPANFPLHHQVILRRPLGEGNTLFISISPEWDAGRAPRGKRALTISTHTDLNQWWYLHDNDPAAYDRQKSLYTKNLLTAVQQVLPGIDQAVDLILPGTPVTFQRFVRRERGWVGGFPQMDLLQAWGPKLAKNLWMVGDSIFPGQSVAAVALGGLRVGSMILREQNVPISKPGRNLEPAL